MEEGEAVVEHFVCCTEGKEMGQTEPGAVVGFEAVQRTAPSGCDKVSPEAEAWENGGGGLRGSGQERRVTGFDVALWGSEVPA